MKKTPCYTVGKFLKNLAFYRNGAAKGYYRSQTDLTAVLCPSMREYAETRAAVAELFPQLPAR